MSGPATIASSTFDTSAGGWVDGDLSDTIYSGPNDVVWDSTTQTITTDDPEGGVNNALIAPSTFVTGAAVGDTLSFQLSDTSNDGVAYSPLSLISQSGVALYAKPTVIPSTSSDVLTQYTIVLNAANFYTGDPDSPSGGTSVSAAAFSSVVGSLAQIAVDLDWHTGADSDRLDNVILSAPGSVAALPDVQPFFTSDVYATLQATLASLTPTSGTLNVVSVAAGGAAGASVAGALNAYVVTAAGAAAGSTVPAGYTDAYQFGGAATLQDNNGATALIGTVAGATLVGAANDTLFGGNAGMTLLATSGAETLFGGTGTNLVELGNATAVADTQGADEIVGSAQAATINAAGSTTYFGAAGATQLNITGGSATVVGGTSETINAGAGSALVFGGASGQFDFLAGSGASTVVSGVGSSASVTGGSGGLLYFGNGATTYNPGVGVDTILGFTGTLTATGGANGTLFFTGTAGGSNVSTGAGSSTIVGLGANDTLTATGSGSDVIEAAAASETINASQSSGPNTFFAFGQGDVVLGGSGSTAIESFVGSQTLVGGSGSTLFEVVDSGTRALTISNFAAGQDYVQLQGYPAGTASAALSSATVSNGNETLALSDGTHVTFLGVTNLTTSAFL